MKSVCVVIVYAVFVLMLLSWWSGKYGVCVCVELCDVFRFEYSSNSVATLSVGNSTK